MKELFDSISKTSISVSNAFMNSFLRLAVVVAVLFQAPPSIVRIGTLAGSLTERDLAAILALPGVLTPWLIHAGRGQIGHYLEVYLPPDTATDAVRRGTFLVGGRRSTIQEGGWGLNSGDSQRNYAQVAVVGRNMNQVVSQMDVARPFELRGTFTDAELLEIVGFIRSNPLSQISNNIGQPAMVMGSLMPIRSISGSAATTVVVDLFIDEFQGERVTLQKQGSNWKALSSLKWIA